jgi:hypothetical protein
VARPWRDGANDPAEVVTAAMRTALDRLASLLGIQPHAQDDAGALIYDPRCWFCRSEVGEPAAAPEARQGQRP